MRGLILGSPGPAGSPAICLLFGAGAPTSSTDPYVSGAAVGSLYIQYDNSSPGLWFRGASGWQQISIP